MDDNPYASPESANDLPPRKFRFSLLKVLGVTGCALVVMTLLIPAPQRTREAARRSQCKNNLKQIGQALANYEQTWHSLPPAYTVDANGRRLHSWRTLILPYLDQAVLYNSIDLSKPWDDPANAKAFQSPVHAYQCPSAKMSANHTTYMAVVTSKSCFRPTVPRPNTEVNYNPAGKLWVIETDPEHAVHWMSPTDVDEKWMLGFSSKSKFPHTGGTYALYADKSVQFLSSETPEEERRALISISDKEK